MTMIARQPPPIIAENPLLTLVVIVLGAAAFSFVIGYMRTSVGNRLSQDEYDAKRRRKIIWHAVVCAVFVAIIVVLVVARTDDRGLMPVVFFAVPILTHCLGGMIALRRRLDLSGEVTQPQYTKWQINLRRTGMFFAALSLFGFGSVAFSIINDVNQEVLVRASPGFGYSILALIGGIGVWRLRQYGRNTMIVLGIMGLLGTAVGTIEHWGQPASCFGIIFGLIWFGGILFMFARRDWQTEPTPPGAPRREANDQ